MSNESSYIWGQCTWYVARTLPWVPAGLGNAKDWLAGAKARGFPISATPQVGDVVVYGPNALGVAPGTEFGHVAIVTVVGPSSFVVEEMNVHGVGIIDSRTQRWPFAGIEGFIRPPQPPENKMTPQEEAKLDHAADMTKELWDITTTGSHPGATNNSWLATTLTNIALAISKIPGTPTAGKVLDQTQAQAYWNESLSNRAAAKAAGATTFSDFFGNLVEVAMPNIT